MDRWVIVFLVFALVAGLLGFTGVIVEAAWFARVVFVAASLIVVVTFTLGRPTLLPAKHP